MKGRGESARKASSSKPRNQGDDSGDYRMPEVAEEYRISRSVLLDTLSALESKKDALIVIGAHAVYINEQASDRSLKLPVAPLTTDCDISIDPSLIGEEPLLDDLMSAAGMTRGSNPGDWRTTKKTESNQDIEIVVDLMVAESVAGKGSRGARLGVHGKRAARRSIGLEGALVDNKPMKVSSLSDGSDDSREIEVKVAGPTALLIAKTHKVCERLESAKGQRREVAKDALDIVRLLSLRSPKENARVLQNLLADDRCKDVTLSALRYLDKYCRSASSEIPELAKKAAGSDARVARACFSYTNRLLREVTASGITY